MFRRSLCLLVLAGVAGCASSPQYNPNKVATASPNAAELAAYAGHAQYPTTQPGSSDLQAAAIISADRGAIKIYNFSREPLRNIDVWVNGSFVQHADGVAPQSSIVIRTNELYNGLGKSFVSQSEPVSRVQIESKGTLYNLWGPAAD